VKATDILRETERIRIKHHSRPGAVKHETRLSLLTSKSAKIVFPSRLLRGYGDDFQGRLPVCECAPRTHSLANDAIACRRCWGIGRQSGNCESVWWICSG